MQAAASCYVLCRAVCPSCLQLWHKLQANVFERTDHVAAEAEQHEELLVHQSLVGVPNAGGNCEGLTAIEIGDRPSHTFPRSCPD